MDAIDQCNNYLISGGLFNPEFAIHDNVRDMIIDCRDQMVAQKAEIEKLREALKEIADFDTYEDISNEECMRDIARAALKEKV